MMRSIKINTMATLFLFSSIFIMLYGCGNNNNTPAGSTIVFNPPSYTASLSGDTCVRFDVIVKFTDGTSMNKVRVTITGPFASPRIPARYQFYSDLNCTNAVNSPFTVETGDTGLYSISVLIPALATGGTTTNAFTDQIQAFSDTAFASASITVQ